MDNLISSEDSASWNTNAKSLSEAGDVSTEMEGKYLTFWTDKQLFGIPIVNVVQIVGMQEITEIPEFPRYVKGIINMRGTIIPVIDIRLRFHKDERDYDERTCIIVTNIDGKAVGFAVDAVDEVTEILDDMISPPLNISKDIGNTYLSGVARHEDKVVLILDSTKILSENEIENITNIKI